MSFRGRGEGASRSVAAGALFLATLGSCQGQAARALVAETSVKGDAPSIPPPEEGPSRNRPWRSPFVRWCSSGGAPIVGLPVVDQQGRAYVATSDGYLHAFERDGRYRWSYTVKGTPLGSVSLRPNDGAILLGTTSRYVYAINQAGTLHWAFRTVSPVWSGLFALNASTVVFLGLDERLYALSNTGAARYRVRAPGTPSIDPVVAEHDVVWVGLGDGVARFVAAYRLEKYPLPSAAEQIIAVGNDAVVRAAGRAFLLRPGAEAKDLGAAHFLAAGAGRWGIVEGSEMRFPDQDLDPIALPDTPSAPPALSPDRLWVPLEDGSLFVTFLAGPSTASADAARRLRVSDQALVTPVLHPGKPRALVATWGGEFCEVELDGLDG